MSRETLAERYARAEAGLTSQGFTEDGNGLWTRGDQTARIVKSKATHNGRAIPRKIKGEPVDPIFREPKLRVEYGSRSAA
jgi:hypothetical protein